MLIVANIVRVNFCSLFQVVQKLGSVATNAQDAAKLDQLLLDSQRFDQDKPIQEAQSFVLVCRRSLLRNSVRAF